MASLIGHLTKAQQSELLKNIYYLNMKEYKGFCTCHSIPFAIYAETKDGLKKTKETDRKGTVLKRVHHFLITGKVLPATVIPAKIVNKEKLSLKLKPSDRLYFSQYDKKNKKMIALLEELTDGKFKNGAVARVLLRQYWTNGKAPTFKEFAQKWMNTPSDSLLAPEYAYLTDLANGEVDSDWKKVRTKKASLALKVINKI